MTQTNNRYELETCSEANFANTDFEKKYYKYMIEESGLHNYCAEHPDIYLQGSRDS